MTPNTRSTRLYPARLTPTEKSLSHGFTELWFEKAPTANELKSLLDFVLTHREIKTARLGERAYAFCTASNAPAMEELAHTLGCSISPSPRDDERTCTDPVARLDVRLPRQLWCDLAKLLGRRLTVEEADALREAWASSFAGTTLPEGIEATLITGLKTRTGKTVQLSIRALALSGYAMTDDESALELAPVYEWQELDLTHDTLKANRKEVK